MELAHLFPASSRFRPIRLLGRGGMGAVFAAEDVRTGGRVAVKVMLGEGPEALLNFKHEFRLVADLSHANLVRLHELFFEGNRWFFTMDLVDGQDLRRTLLEEGGELSTRTTHDATGDETQDTVLDPVFDPRREEVGARWRAAGRGREPICDPEVLCLLLGQVVEGLEHLHQHGVTHRDLKPTNVLVGVDGRVRLADFGLASRQAPGERRGRSPAGGTLGYMAPELWQDGGAEASSDRYALGCMMYELLTGQLPYERPPSWRRRSEIERPRIEDRVDGVAPALAALAYALIAPRPADRPGLDEVRRVLRAPARAARREARAVFVGREPEMARIHEALTAVEGGEARTVLLVGASGIGKSSLAAQAAASARERGFLVLEGRCHEREQIPFAALDRPIDALVEHLRGSSEEALAPQVQALRPMFPVLAALAAPGAPAAAPEGDARALRDHALRAFASLLDGLQRRQPTALFVDDLHWVDEDSASLLTEVLCRAKGRLLLLLALRGDPPPRVRALVEAARSAGGLRLDLPPLAPGEIAALLDRLGVSGSTRQIAVGAEGNPFLVRLLADGALSVGSLGALVAGRLAQLSPEGQALLRLLAVLSGDAPVGVLRQASGLPVAAFDRALAELVAACLARTQPDGRQPRIGAYHDRIREGVDGTLDDASRRALHGSLGAAFEQASGTTAETLLYHWTGAGDQARRWRYGRLAVEQAERKLAFARAGQLYAELLAESELAESPREWERAGDLLRFSGHFDQAIGPYQRARQLQERAEGPGASPAPALLRITGHLAECLVRAGHVAEGQAEWARGQALLGRPLERPAWQQLPILAGLSVQSWVDKQRARRGVRPETPEDRAQLDFLIAQFRTMLPLWPMPLQEAVLRCEALAHQVGDRQNLRQILFFRCLSTACFERPTDQRLKHAMRLLSESQKHDGPPRGELEQALFAITWAVLRAPRQPALALDWIQPAIERLDEVGLARSTVACSAHGIRLLLLQIAENHDASLAASAAELARPNPDLPNTVFALWVQVRIYTIRGEVDLARAAERQLEACLERVPPSALSAPLWSARWMRAWAESRSREALAHGAHLEAVSRELRREVSPFLRAVVYALPIEPALDLARTGSLPRAALAPVRSWARETAEAPWFGQSCRGHRALGLLALHEGRLAEARGHLQRALHASRGEPAYRRWLCLEAARPLGLLSAHECSELRRLAEEGRFVRPV